MAKRSRLRTREEKRRWLLVFLVVSSIFCGGIGGYLVFHRPEIIEQLVGSWADKSWSKSENRDLIRGTVYDRNYKEMAVSYERVSVYANIREIESFETVTTPLSEILGESKDAISTRLSGSGLRLWLARDISQKQEDEIRQLEIPGIFLHKEYVRYHPQKESAAHLLGFVENDTGLSGIEFRLNQLQTKYRINAGNIGGLKKVSDSIPGADGRHFILTLDLKIQKILDRYVQVQSADNTGIRVGALTVEASTGAIVGYAQTPSFDPNQFHTYPESVFVDVFNQQIAVPTSYKIFLRDLSLFESQLNGNLLPWSILAEKRKLGVQLQLWEKLGIARTEDYDFVSAAPGNPDRIAFDKSGTGHRDFETVPAMLTPLQMLTALSRSMNGGDKTVLHVSDRYVVRRNQSEYLLEDLAPADEKIQIDKGIYSEIVYLLKAVCRVEQLKSLVIEGTSSSYQQKQGEREFFRHHISFVVIPSPNPELILMVVSDRPGYNVPRRYGDNPMADISRLIAPIAARQQVMKNLADMMKPKEQEEKNFSIRKKEGVQTAGAPFKLEDKPEVLIAKMPNLVGMSLRKSLRFLQNSGVEIKVNGTGRVVSHEPPAGSALVSGSGIILNLERDDVDSGIRVDVSKPASTQ